MGNSQAAFFFGENERSSVYSVTLCFGASHCSGTLYTVTED
jgi:hypothetical protein